MIKFFRQIRYKLMNENKTSRYFKYAIGEIVLVVIGILIALQINNWNENKKDRVFELKMLKEIRNEIIHDTAYFNMIKSRAQELNEGATGLIQYLDVPNPPLDSIIKYRSKILGFQFIYRKGAYEALKTTGIDKISNDSLRLKLTNYYDFILPRTSILLDNRIEFMYNWNSHMKEIAELQIVKDSTGFRTLEYNPKSIYKNTKAAEILKDYYEVGSRGVRRINNVIENSEDVLQRLNSELQIND